MKVKQKQVGKKCRIYIMQRVNYAIYVVPQYNKKFNIHFARKITTAKVENARHSKCTILKRLSISC